MQYHSYPPSRERVPCAVLIALASLYSFAAVAASIDEAGQSKDQTVGRVAIRLTDSTPQRSWEAAREALTKSLTESAAIVSSTPRLLSLHAAHAGGFQATIYVDAQEQAYEVILDGAGRELLRKPIDHQPPLGDGEFEAAANIVRTDEHWRDALASGNLILYEPMPPVSVSPLGGRSINVGIATPDLTKIRRGTNQIVSVSLGSGVIVQHNGGAPLSALAVEDTCGVTPGSCSPDSNNGFSSFQVSWPTSNPVWSFTVVRPRSTSTLAEINGTGIELREVRYKGRLVLVRAHMPIMNVEYEFDTCGPYRDWLDQEDCFQAIGTDVSPGIRVCTQEPATLCASGTDAGNFNGVAIWDEGTSLWLATECAAGWYRYVMEWRLHLDGSIEPIMGFGATQDSCVCNHHTHHGYWRFDLAPDGTLNGDTVTGSTQVERGGPSNMWTPIAQELATNRPTSNPVDDWWRVRNPVTGFGVLLKPGGMDLGAAGDSFAKADNWVLAYHSNEISDGRFLGDGTDQTIRIHPWINNESLTSGRVVLWYHAGFEHDITHGENEPCHMVGPRLELACDFLPLPTPTAPVCGSAVQTTTPRLNWDDVANASGYIVKLHSGIGCTGTPIHASGVLPQTMTSYKVPESVGLQPGVYSWAVRAKGDGANFCDGPFSSCCSFQVEGDCEDVCEYNNTFASACAVSCNTTNRAKLCTADDVDFYRIVASGSGTMTLELMSPPGHNYDLVVYNSSHSLLCSSTAGTGAVDSCTVPVVVGQAYFVEIAGAGNDFSPTTGYTLSVSCPVCTILETPVPSTPACGSQIYTNRPTLQWGDVPQDKGYVVRVFNGSGCTGSPIHTSRILPANTTSYIVPASAGLQAGHAYSWQVRAKGKGPAFCDSVFSGCCSFNISDCADLCEPNDSFATACALSCGTTNRARICSSTDMDTYRFVPSGDGPVTIRMAPPSGKDYDLYVFDATENELCSSRQGTGATDACTVTTMGGHTYYILVAGYNGSFSTTADYTLSVSCRSCTVLTAPTLVAPICGSVVSNTTPKLRWRDVPQDRGYVVKIYGAESCVGTPLHTSPILRTNATSYIVPASVGLRRGETYSWQVRAKGDANNICDSAFSTCCTFTVFANCVDLGEPNNSFGAAYDLGCSGSNTARICSSTDVDYYQVNPTDSGIMSVRMTPPLDRDFDLHIYDGNQEFLCSSTLGTGSTDMCEVAVSAGQNYYIYVFGFSGGFSATTSYTLTVTCP